MGKLYDLAIEFKNNYNQFDNIHCDTANISVIIPVYHPEHLDTVLGHLSKFDGIREVLLVDDTGDKEGQQFVFQNELNVKLIKHKKNMGRPAARNTGAAYATGNILVFMDQDMILAPDFLNKASRALLANRGKGIVLGLRTTVPFREIPSYESWEYVSPSKDWRHLIFVEKDFVDLTASGAGSYKNSCSLGESLEIYNRSLGLRTLGVAPSSTIGFWDLPSMVVSHSMAMSKNEFLNIGGFPEWIRGWGGEDIAIGFAAIAAQNPIMLVDSVSYHIQHLPHSGSEAKKNQELAANIAAYRKWAQSIDCIAPLNINHLKNRGYIC